jgi:hypothetical protein
MMARPRPPLCVHSSFATRSSLFCLIILYSVVTFAPDEFSSVWVREQIQRTAGRTLWRKDAPRSGRGNLVFD